MAETDQGARARTHALFRRWLVFLPVCALALAVDQSVKAAVHADLAVDATRHLGPLLLRHVENPGVGLPPFEHGRPAVVMLGLVAIALLVVAAFAAWGSIHPLAPAACAVSLGGVLGNLLDHARHESITDFVAIGSLPIFNLADVFVLGGLATMTVLCFVVDYRSAAAPEADRSGSDGAPAYPARDSRKTGSNQPYVPVPGPWAEG